MRTKPVLFRYRLYLLSVGGLALLTTLLRTLALCLNFDANIGYFTAGGALPRLTHIAELVTLAVCCTLPLLVYQKELPEQRAPLSLAGQINAGIAALLFLLTAGYLFINSATIPAPSVLVILASLALLAGAAYFILPLLGKEQAATPFAYGAILAAVLVLSITYFDRYTQMNAPHKLSLHLSMLSIMLFLLYELRAAIGRPMPRALALTAALCFFTCATYGTSNLIAFALGIYADPLYLMGDLLSMGFAAYVASRALSDLSLLSPASTATESEEPTV